MVQRVLAGGNVALHGGPGTGKSYTANLLADELSVDSNVTCVKLDLSTMSTGAEVFASLVTGFGGSVQDSAGVHEAWTALQASCANVSGRRPFVLDEFDAVLRFPDGDPFLRHLRELLHNTARSQLCAVIASRRNIRVLEESVRGISTLEGVFAPYYLSTLAKADVEQGWRHQEISSCEWADLRSWSGGVPRLVDLYLSANVRGASDARDAELGRHEWVERQLDYFDAVGLGEAVAQHVLGPIVKRDPVARARLLAMRVIGEAGDEEGPTLETFEVFVTCLRARHEQTLGAWGSLGAAEAAARRLLRAVLESAGVGSVADVEATEGCPEAVRRILRDGEAASQTHGSTSKSLASIVGALKRGEYWKLVDSLWDRIGATMSPPDREYWRLRLSGLGGVGWSPGQQWEVDSQELDQWAQEITAGHGLIERRLERGSMNQDLTRATINVTASEGSVVGIGQDVSASSRKERSVAKGEKRRVTWFQKVSAGVGFLAGLAGILTLVYYVIDR